MARQGENIYQRKDGRWEGKYIKSRTNGKINYGYVTGQSYEQVLKRKRDKLQGLQNGGIHEASDPLLMSNLSSKWLDSRRGSLKETSISKYNSVLKTHIIPQYGDRQADDITEDEVKLWLEGLTTRDGDKTKVLSAKTANSITSVLRLILCYGRTCYAANTVLLDDVHLKQSKKPIEILSHSERRKLEAYLMDNMELDALGILTSLYTGIRLGEVCALRWDCVHWSDEVLDIHATMSRVDCEDNPDRKTEIIITLPKSDCSVRQIPIPSDLLAIMRQMRRADDSFFLTGSNTEYMNPRTMENHFKAALKKCGVAPVKYHALRHSFATRCVELGFDIKTLSEILGHANVTITMNRYVHPTIVMKKDYMDRLSLTYGENFSENRA